MTRRLFVFFIPLPFLFQAPSTDTPPKPLPDLSNYFRLAINLSLYTETILVSFLSVSAVSWFLDFTALAIFEPILLLYFFTSFNTAFISSKGFIIISSIGG